MNGLHRSGSFDSPVSQLFPPAQHLTSKLCKHSALIKLDVVIIMRDDILTLCPLKRFRKRKYEFRGSISLCWKKNHLCPAEQKKVWKETGQGGLGRGKSANKDKDLNPISPMVTSTVYPACWSQKIIKEFRTRKKYNESHHFTAGIYFFFAQPIKKRGLMLCIREELHNLKWATTIQVCLKLCVFAMAARKCFEKVAFLKSGKLSLTNF